MKLITANQLTVSRIVLMPVPVAMLFCPDRWVQLAGWALYIVVGVTDYFDGVLARRDGFTRFGRLTDPIADKIYVALTFLTLTALGFMDPWITVALIMRDPIITALRSLSERHGITMKTATLAKYKTGIQMIAGGYIMFAGIVPEKIPALMSMGSLATFVWMWYMLKGGTRDKWDTRLLVMGGLMTIGVNIRWLAPLDLTLLLYSLIILVVTWASVWGYLADFAAGVKKAAKRPAAVWWALYAVESGVVPLFVMGLLFQPMIPPWLIMAVISIELSVGALDNILTAERHERSPRHVGLKLAAQLAIAAAFSAIAFSPFALPITAAPVLAVLAYVFGAVSLVSAVIGFARYAPRIL